MKVLDPEILAEVASLPLSLAQYAYAAFLHEKAHTGYLLERERLLPSLKTPKKRIKRNLGDFYLDNFRDELYVLYQWEKSSEKDSEPPQLLGKALDDNVELAIEYIESIISQGGIELDSDDELCLQLENAWEAYAEKAQFAIDLFQGTRIIWR